MIKEAIELIQGTAVKAEHAHKLFESRDGREVTYSVKGEIQKFELGISPRAHVVGSLNDLIRYVKMQVLGVYSIWHNCCGVRLLCNDADRSDKVTFDLTYSDAANKLFDMSNNKNRFEQSEFVRLLHRTFQVDASIVGVFRKLDFKIVQAAEGEFQHGKDRIGKSVQAEVAGTNAIPEVISISVPLYSNTGERDCHQIWLDVDLDAQRSQIICSPKPCEIEAAIDSHQDSIRERILAGLGEDIKVYRGNP